MIELDFFEKKFLLHLKNKKILESLYIYEEYSILDEDFEKVRRLFEKKIEALDQTTGQMIEKINKNKPLT